MNRLPPALTRYSPTWFLTVFLSVIGDLSGMLATFMPMKTILILAAEDVPGFFPVFLVEGGPTYASVILLLIAAGLGVTAKLISFAIGRLDHGYRYVFFQPAEPYENSRDIIRHAESTRTSLSSGILLIPVLAVLVFFSVPYLIFALVWLALSAVGILFLVRQSTRSPRYATGTDQFNEQLTLWLKKSSLWSMVGLAVLTLIVSPPALGPTAILIAAIFGRRFLLALSVIIPRLTLAVVRVDSSEVKPRFRPVVTNAPVGTGKRRPIHFLAIDSGRREIGKYLVAEGMQRADYRVVGDPHAKILTLACGQNGGSGSLVRLFGSEMDSNRYRELSHRNNPPIAGLFPPGRVELSEVVGFSAIKIAVGSPEFHADLSYCPTQEESMEYHIKTELAALHGSPTSDSDDDIQTLERRLVEGLEAVSRIPGPHVEACDNVGALVSEALGKVKALPRGLVPSRPIQATDLYRADNGEFFLLNDISWTFARAGFAWRKNSSRYLECLKEFQESGESGLAVDPQLAEIHARLRSLLRSLEQFDLSGLEREIHDLGEKFNKPNIPD